MKHILDFTKSDEETAVSRILALVHQAIDREFPGAEPAPTRFAKTIFGDEPTLNEPLPDEIVFAQNDERVKRISNDPLAVQNLADPTSNSELHQQHDRTAQAPFPASRERRLRQTIIATVVLGIGLLISYLVWNKR